MKRIVVAVICLAYVCFAGVVFASIPYPNTFVYQDITLGCDAGVENRVGVGNRRHFYSFDATAGQQVTFGLDWKLPESSRRGAAIWVLDGVGEWLAYDEDWWSNAISVDVVFPEDGEYFVYVSHSDFWGLEGEYPYELDVFCGAPICARVTILGYDGETTIYAAREYAAGQAAAAYDYWPTGMDTYLELIERDVFPGACEDFEEDWCEHDEPDLCGWWIWWYWTFHDTCEFQNYINNQATIHGEYMAAFAEGECSF